MADATMEPMPMVGEEKMGEEMAEEGHGPSAMQANLHYLLTTFFMATSLGLSTFRYDSATDAYDAWTSTYG